MEHKGIISHHSSVISRTTVENKLHMDTLEPQRLLPLRKIHRLLLVFCRWLTLLGAEVGGIG